MNSDDIIDDFNENTLANKLNKDKNIISYLSDIFLGNNDENDNNKIYDDNDFQENYEESYYNLLNLSKMNMSEINKYFEINNNNFDNNFDNMTNMEFQKQNSYNKKYSNMLNNDNTNNYEIDYELQINDKETITFLKSKK